MTPARERPILFSAPMVRAILAGTKTQTRRVISQQPARDERGVMMWPIGKHRRIGFENQDIHPDLCEHCPYGQPGDLLWVREAHAFSVVDPEGRDWRDDPENWDVIYRADEKQPAGGWRDSDGNVIPPPWRPSIHMPRWASRMTLEISDVRVERLQDISEAGAIAEGVEPVIVGEGWRRYCDAGMELAGVVPCETARGSYRSLWELMNGPDSWDANPWVWVLTFVVAT